MGAVVGAALAVVWVVWMRTRTPPCPGAVTLEFHPPLAEPGRYQIKLDWDDGKPCTVTVSVPLDGTKSGKDKTGCGMAVELRTLVQAGSASISGLTFAAAPARFKLNVKRNSETVYDTALEPKYAPYETLRADNAHFCGDRALVQPACVRGSSECAPFPASCSGPEACAKAQACCLTPEWAKDFGPRAGTECTSVDNCFAHLGHIGCHLDADCPSGMRCGDSSLAADFSPSILVCQAR
jgi:hypothetical protein